MGSRLALSIVQATLYWVASQWGPWSFTELIHITSLGLMPGGWLELAAGGSILAVVISSNMPLKSDLHSCLRSILDNAISMPQNLHVIYSETALHLVSVFHRLVSIELEGFDAVLNFQCLLSFYKRAHTSVAWRTFEAVIMSAFWHVLTVRFAFPF